MWGKKSTLDKFEEISRADRMLLLYLRDFNTRPRYWWKYPEELINTSFWRCYQRSSKGLDPVTGWRASIST